MSETTIFDKILAKEIPADVVYEDDAVLAFKDINPQAPTHILVIPKKRIPGYADLLAESDAFVGDYMKKVAKVAQELGLNGDGYRIVFNYGKNGQQTVNHIHAHILGGRGMSWPPG
ncbi:MAG: histidine triad nucleotide-binding protein [Pseudobacteriovorax sp.]|nr:histidine triad nucleotide-binding protein [Pseudobacteriovorax sp.]